MKLNDMNQDVMEVIRTYRVLAGPTLTGNTGRMITWAQKIIVQAKRFSLTPKEYTEMAFESVKPWCLKKGYQTVPFNILASDFAAREVQKRSTRDKLFYNGQKMSDAIQTIDAMIADGIDKLWKRLALVTEQPPHVIDAHMAERELILLAGMGMVHPAYVCAWVHAHASDDEVLMTISSGYREFASPETLEKLYWAHRKKVQLRLSGRFAKYV